MQRRKGADTIISRDHAISAAIWLLIGAVFLADVSTPADDVSVVFAYIVPVIASLFESHPRPLRYACATTMLAICGLILLPPNHVITFFMVGISITTQWAVALLVRQEGRRLQEANERAESQRRFVDILSHEVGTALTTISGQSYRLTQLSEQLAPSELRLRAEKIRKAGERIEAIISRIQFASALGDGSFPGGDGVVSLGSMLEQLADQIREEHPGRTIALQVGERPVYVTGDEMLLRQIFENVITNGIKYSPAAEPVTVSVNGFKASVRVVVTDKGHGMSEDELERVRHPYYRGANSVATSGAGLGLFVVEKLVEAQRGSLLLESRVGAGTRVTIDLPLASMAGVP